MIFKIIKNKAYRVSIAPSISEKEYIEKYMTKDMMIFDETEVPNFPFLKLENGVLVEDDQIIEKSYVLLNKKTAEDLLSKTDYMMLIDNPASLSEEDLKTVIEFRIKLRESRKNGTAINYIPSLLRNKSDFLEYFDNLDKSEE